MLIFLQKLCRIVYLIGFLKKIIGYKLFVSKIYILSNFSYTQLKYSKGPKIDDYSGDMEALVWTKRQDLLACCYYANHHHSQDQGGCVDLDQGSGCKSSQKCSCVVRLFLVVCSFDIPYKFLLLRSFPPSLSIQKWQSFCFSLK